jgi:tol-pal system protein YbgF
MKNIAKALCATAAVIALGGCVQQRDLDLLEVRIAQQERHVDSLTRELNNASRQIDSVQPSQADLWAQVQTMRNDVALLQGQMDALLNTEDSLPEAMAQIKELRADADRMELALRQIESEFGLELEVLKRPAPAAPSANATRHNATVQNATRTLPAANATMAIPENDPVAAAVTTLPVATTRGKTPGNATGGAPAQIQPPQGNTTAQTAPKADPADMLYEQALASFKERNYQAAQRQWKEFATAFPAHAMVANAVFWQGECFYQMEDYARAVLAYQDVVTKHADSSKYLPAMLKQGISLIRLGKTKAGKIRLEEITKKHPGTPEAKRAATVLKETK